MRRPGNCHPSSAYLRPKKRLGLLARSATLHDSHGAHRFHGSGTAPPNWRLGTNHGGGMPALVCWPAPFVSAHTPAGNCSPVPSPWSDTTAPVAVACLWVRLGRPRCPSASALTATFPRRLTRSAKGDLGAAIRPPGSRREGRTVLTMLRAAPLCSAGHFGCCALLAV